MFDFKKVSAIVLSGGKSSRMGTDKCDLIYNNESLINLQIDKLYEVGIEDIIAAGYRGKNCRTKIVKDDIMKGPLSGIYVGLNDIKNDRAFVISVDVPLVKKETIKKIIDYSFEQDLDIAMVRHHGNKEPLIGVYKKELVKKIEMVLRSDSYSVMKLADMCKYEFLDVEDDDDFLNVNYKDDYDKLLKVRLEGGK